MNNQELKKTVQHLIKKYSEQQIHFDGLQCKYKLSSFHCLYLKNKKVKLGWIQYSFVSNRFSAIDSAFGFYISAGFRCDDFHVDDIPPQFQLLRYLKGLDISSIRNKCICSNSFYGFGSLNTLNEIFYDDGIVSIFENEDLEMKIEQVVQKVNELYVPHIKRFLTGDINLLNDIIEYPYNFGYPLITAEAVCRLNNQENKIDDTIKKIQCHKWMKDSTDELKIIFR